MLPWSSADSGASSNNCADPSATVSGLRTSWLKPRISAARLSTSRSRSLRASCAPKYRSPYRTIRRSRPLRCAAASLCRETSGTRRLCRGEDFEQRAADHVLAPRHRRAQTRLVGRDHGEVRRIGGEQEIGVGRVFEDGPGVAHPYARITRSARSTRVNGARIGRTAAPRRSSVRRTVPTTIPPRRGVARSRARARAGGR